MSSLGELPWIKIHQFLLDVGATRDPKDLCVRLIERIHSLIPYDQARVYFVNDAGKIYDQILIGVDPSWSDVYLEHYSRIENGRYSIWGWRERGLNLLPQLEGGVWDWTTYTADQFKLEYIRPQRINYSAGFGLHDADGLIKSVYMLDRTCVTCYSRREVDIMRVIQPHVDNLHRNLFVHSPGGVRNGEARKLLTNREAQIAGLLCKGLTPTRIAQSLALSLPTVYKHIAHIHAKLDVSNRQELLLKLLN